MTGARLGRAADPAGAGRVGRRKVAAASTETIASRIMPDRTDITP